MKVKIFASSFGVKSLENRINTFLQNERVNVLKIHFDSSFGTYSALIEYEEN